jgi:hypothetical protein
MAWTRAINASVPEELEMRARAAAPEVLDGLDKSMLVRVGLATLAGDDLPTALRAARDALQRRGPSPKPAAA